MRYALPIITVIIIFSGCGTLIPGPRYKVNVDDFAFTSDGMGVVYQEDRLRYYPFLLGFREGHDLYLYDRERRTHRHLARADAFSVSPFGPLILYSPPWGKRFKNQDKMPDFYLLNYKSGKKRGFCMPPDFDRDYLSYGFSCVRWEREGPLTAYAGFVYCPGERPRSWKRQGTPPPDWHAKMWKVRIDPSLPGDRVAEAVAWDGKSLPGVPWREIHRQKFVSPDGKEKLAFSKYNGHYTFNTTLSVRSGEAAGEEYIARENRLINIVQMGKSILYYIGAAPILGLNSLVQK
jgi:hypothetical protein